MEFNIIKKPELFNWSGNSINFVFACTPFGLIQRQNDIRLKITLQVEIAKGTGIFRDIKSETLTPDNEGLIKFDVSSLADPFLKYSFPELNTLASGKANEQSKIFKVKYQTYQSGLLDAELESAPFIVLKGGLPFDGLKASSEWADTLGAKFMCLNTPQILDTNQPSFASFVYLGADPIYSPKFSCVISLGDVETPTSHIMNFILEQGDVFYLPLQKLVNQAESDLVRNLKINFKDDSNLLIHDQDFKFKQRRFFKCSDLLFINSLGGIDTLRLIGEQTSTGDYNQTFIKKGNKGNQNRDILPSTIQEGSATVQQKFGGNTGFVLKSDNSILQALMLHKQAYQVIRQNILLPVIIVKKSLPAADSNAFLYDAQIEWVEANEHKFYSHINALTPSDICPALISFTAVQESSTSIRVAWSCPDPYQNIRVKIYVGGTGTEPIAERDFSGSTGSDILTVDASGEIIASGQLICGLITQISGESTTSLGVATLQNITLLANRPPVAVPDEMQITTGFTTPQLLVGNVLDNDYDPDGDAIEVVGSAGATQQGGFYNITTDGKIFYKAPTPLFSGIDKFDYKIKEVISGTLSNFATVTINIISSSGSEIVYAKMVTAGDNNYAIIFIKYYSDALCTIAKDVTTMNLSFNYKKKTLIKNISNSTIISDTEETLFIRGSGKVNMIYSGPLISFENSGVTVKMTTIQISLLPGQGYIIA